MEPEIRETPVDFEVVGLSCAHDPGKTHGQEILALLDRVWPVLRASGARHDGINRVVYDEDCSTFAGVIADVRVPGLETKVVRLGPHAYWKHVGPYRLIGRTGEQMRAKLAARGVVLGWPMVEVYGHWTEDESRLETETMVALRA
jgi:hypothetical protein